MEIPTTGFGQRMTKIREAHRWTQADLARRLDVHVTWVSKLERYTGSDDDPKGVRDPAHLPIVDLFRLADALDVSPWSLLTGWEPMRIVKLDDEREIEALLLWEWASWESAPPHYDDEAVAIWQTFSPKSVDVSIHDVIEGLTDVLGRYEERISEDGTVEIVRVLSPAAEKAIEQVRHSLDLVDDAIEADFNEGRE